MNYVRTCKKVCRFIRHVLHNLKFNILFWGRNKFFLFFYQKKMKARGKIICDSINKYNKGFMDWHLVKGSFTDVTDRLVADLLAMQDYNRFDFNSGQIMLRNTAMSMNFLQMSPLYNSMSPVNVIFSSDLFLIQMMK